jgi:hypothetical protein
MSIQNSPRRSRVVLGLTKIGPITGYHLDPKPLTDDETLGAIDILLIPGASNTGTTYLGWETSDDSWIPLTNGSTYSLANGTANQGLTGELLPFLLSKLFIKSVSGASGDSCKVFIINQKKVDRAEV